MELGCPQRIFLGRNMPRLFALVVLSPAGAKGRTYEELDLLFEQGVSARKFRETVVDPYEGEEEQVEVREEHHKD